MAYQKKALYLPRDSLPSFLIALYIYLVSVQALSPGVKRPQTTAEVKNVWIFTCTPLNVLMALCLII
jgi:hypothetical protein